MKTITNPEEMRSAFDVLAYTLQAVAGLFDMTADAYHMASKRRYETPGNRYATDDNRMAASNVANDLARQWRALSEDALISADIWRDLGRPDAVDLEEMRIASQKLLSYSYVLQDSITKDCSNDDGAYFDHALEYVTELASEQVALINQVATVYAAPTNKAA